MTHHVIPSTCCQRGFERGGDPAVEVDSGDVVTFQTTDWAYERLWRGVPPEEIPDEDYNIVTGPVVVRSAEPGDALRIDIGDIQIHRAWSVWIPEFGPLGDLTDRVHADPLAIEDGRLRLSDRMTVPLEPMIGCIGLAPDCGTGSTLEPAYCYGGNLDLRELSSGAVLYLPVQAPGGWLSVGDLHAAMGAGEPAHLSLEAAGDVTLRLTVEKNRGLDSPQIWLPGRTLCVAVMDLNGSLEEATQLATRQAYNLLRTEFGLTATEAHGYLSARVSLRFGGPASPIVIADVPHPDLMAR